MKNQNNKNTTLEPKNNELESDISTEQDEVTTTISDTIFTEEEEEDEKEESEEDKKQRAQTIKAHQDKIFDTLRKQAMEERKDNFDEEPDSRPSMFSRFLGAFSCTSTSNVMDPNQPDELDIQKHDDSRTSPRDESRPGRKVRFEGDTLDETELHQGTTPYDKEKKKSFAITW